MAKLSGVREAGETVFQAGLFKQVLSNSLEKVGWHSNDDLRQVLESTSGIAALPKDEIASANLTELANQWQNSSPYISAYLSSSEKKSVKLQRQTLAAVLYAMDGNRNAALDILKLIVPSNNESYNAHGSKYDFNDIDNTDSDFRDMRIMLFNYLKSPHKFGMKISSNELKQKAGYHLRNLPGDINVGSRNLFNWGKTRAVNGTRALTNGIKNLADLVSVHGYNSFEKIRKPAGDVFEHAWVAYSNMMESAFINFSNGVDTYEARLANAVDEYAVAVSNLSAKGGEKLAEMFGDAASYWFDKYHNHLQNLRENSTAMMSSFSEPLSDAVSSFHEKKLKAYNKGFRAKLEAKLKSLSETEPYRPEMKLSEPVEPQDPLTPNLEVVSKRTPPPKRKERTSNSYEKDEYVPIARETEPFNYTPHMYEPDVLISAVMMSAMKHIYDVLKSKTSIDEVVQQTSTTPAKIPQPATVGRTKRDKKQYVPKESEILPVSSDGLEKYFRGYHGAKVPYFERYENIITAMVKLDTLWNGGKGTTDIKSLYKEAGFENVHPVDGVKYLKPITDAVDDWMRDRGSFVKQVRKEIQKPKSLNSHAPASGL